MPFKRTLFPGATAVSLCCAAMAVGAGAPTEATRTQTIPDGGQTLTNAKCPAGKAPVSGGFELKPGDNALAFNTLEGIDLDLKRWSLNTESFGDNSRLTSFAYCSRLGRDVKFRSDRTDLAPGDAATITATCRRNEKALSGGYAYVASGLPAGLTESSFRPDPRSWSIKAINFGTNQFTLFAFAHCVPKGKVPDVQAVHKSVTFNDEDATTVTTQCPRGRYALSGGYKIPDVLPEAVRISHRTGTRGWKITADGISGRDDKITVFAYCARK